MHVFYIKLVMSTQQGATRLDAKISDCREDYENNYPSSDLIDDLSKDFADGFMVSISLVSSLLQYNMRFIW